MIYLLLPNSSNYSSSILTQQHLMRVSTHGQGGGWRRGVGAGGDVREQYFIGFYTRDTKATKILTILSLSCLQVCHSQEKSQVKCLFRIVREDTFVSSPSSRQDSSWVHGDFTDLQQCGHRQRKSKQRDVRQSPVVSLELFGFIYCRFGGLILIKHSI